MHPKVKKLVFVIQDLETKDKEMIAIVSGDVHVDDGKTKEIISFQTTLDSNPDFQRCIKQLVAEALELNKAKKAKKNGTK